MYLQIKCFEYTVGKGEIAHNKKFLLFPYVFYPCRENSAINIKFSIVILKLF